MYLLGGKILIVLLCKLENLYSPDKSNVFPRVGIENAQKFP